jgi:hypothetical protein
LRFDGAEDATVPIRHQVLLRIVAVGRIVHLGRELIVQFFDGGGIVDHALISRNGGVWAEIRGRSYLIESGKPLPGNRQSGGKSSFAGHNGILQVEKFTETGALNIEKAAIERAIDDSGADYNH